MGKLKLARQYNNVSQEMLITLLKIKQTATYRRKENTGDFWIWEAKKLAMFYDTTIKELFYSEDSLETLPFISDITRRIDEMSQYTIDNFTSTLSWYRKGRNISTMQLANVLGYKDISGYLKLESRGAKIRLNTAKKISDFYNIDIDSLIFFSKDSDSNNVYNTIDIKHSDFFKEPKIKNLIKFDYSSKLIYLREKNNLSVYDMLSVINAKSHKSYISIEKGNRELSLEAAIKLAAFYKVDLDSLVIENSKTALNLTKRKRSLAALNKLRILIQWEISSGIQKESQALVYSTKTKLWYLRIERHLSFNQVSKELNIHLDTYRKIERGFVKSTLSIYANLAYNCYGLTLSELFL